MIMMTLIEDFLKVLDVYDDFLKSLHEKILHVHEHTGCKDVLNNMTR